MAVAEKPKKEVIVELGQRLEEIEDRNEPQLQKAIERIRGDSKSHTRL